MCMCVRVCVCMHVCMDCIHIPHLKILHRLRCWKNWHRDFKMTKNLRCVHIYMFMCKYVPTLCVLYHTQFPIATSTWRFTYIRMYVHTALILCSFVGY